MPAELMRNFSDFLVPTQAALTICYPPPPSTTTAPPTSSEYFPSDQMFIKTFDKYVDVMATKAKPKKIGLSTTSGQFLKFLVKQEKDGDLRKDERELMWNVDVDVGVEFNLHVSILLYCIVLHCTVLHCSVLYCTPPSFIPLPPTSTDATNPSQ